MEIRLEALIFGILAFAVSIIVHAVLARRLGLRFSTWLLCTTLIIVSSAVIFLLCIFDTSPNTIDEGLLAFALSGSLAVAYLVANTAIETDSPTQSLVLFLHGHRLDGVSEEMIDKFIDERPFRDSRLEGLVKDGLVERHGDRFVCNARGQQFLDLLDAYRKVIHRIDATG
jgi:hypothetical protein